MDGFLEQPLAFDPRTALLDNAVLASQRKAVDYGTALKMVPPIASGIGAHRRLDWQSIFLAFALPVCLFVATFSVMSFSFFYRYPTTAIFLVALAFFLVLLLTVLSIHPIHKARLTGVKTWHRFIIATAFLACCLGSLLGYLNYTWNASPYFNYISLRRVVDVDPGQWSGQQALDAGELDFKAGTKINTSLNMLYYKNTGCCVAPLVSKDGLPLASYDFWAVGIDCCGSQQGDWSCASDLNDVPGSSGSYVPKGLRVLDDSLIACYTLAVEQAQSAYQIQVHNPVFLQIVKQPYSTIKHEWKKVMTFTYICLALYAIFQMGLVAFQAKLFGTGEPSGFLADA